MVARSGPARSARPRSPTLLGKPGNNPYCHHRALELARKGLRERVMRVGPAPALPFDRAEFELCLEPLP